MYNKGYMQFANILMSSHEITKVPLNRLRPTQIAAGHLEAMEKLEHIHRLNASALDEYLRTHSVPVIEGPDGILYALDRHHLGLALHAAGIEYAYCQIESDVPAVSMADFWKKMHERHRVYPFDANGILRDYSQLPSCFSGLADDPYRSLAGFVRNNGGFQKDHTPYAEFLWADYFRKEIPLELMCEKFSVAIEAGMAAAKLKKAKNLPGFIALEISE